MAIQDEFENAFATLMRKENEELSPAQLAAKKIEDDATAAAAGVTDPSAAATATAEAAKAAEVAAPEVPAKADTNPDGTPLTEEQIAEKAAADATRDAKAAEDAAIAAKATQAAEAAEAARAADDERLARFAEKIAEKTKPAVKSTVASDAPAPFSAEEIKALTQYEKDWPDVFKAQQVIARAQTQSVVTYMLQEFAKVIAPMQERLEALAGRQTEADITSAIPDYDTVYAKVTQWVDKQPGYLQPALKHVMAQGTVDEVTDLIGRWRKETGNTAAQPAALAQPATKDTELSPAAKKAAAALAPVGSKRTVIVGNAAAEDYDSAFAEAAKLE